MRAVQIERFGDPDGLVVVDRPEPEPAPGQVAVAVEAIGVGGVDAVIRRGTIGGGGLSVGTVPGSEVAGTVRALGAGVDPIWIGRRVWAFTGMSGGYAETAVADLADVTPLPDALGAVDAVTLGSAATVARFALAHAHVAAGESVLVRGAAGSIGIAAVELAARGGASVVAVTTSSAERGRRLRALGATHVLDRAGHDLADDGADIAASADSADVAHAGAPAPAEFDVVVDIVGGSGTAAWIDRLASNGRLVLVGAVAGMPTDVGPALLGGFRRSRSVATFSLDSVPAEIRAAARASLFADAVRGVQHSVVHDVLPLRAAADAHRAMDDGTVFGRIVLDPRR